MFDAPLLSDEMLDAASRDAMEKGIKVLQGAVLAPTDEGHVSALLAMMAPPEGAVIVDAGCGFGEVARLMRAERGDLDFILVNKSALQLEHAPSDFQHILCDMHTMLIPTASVDGVMFCYSICHADFCAAVREAARITKTGGFLFVYDYERISGNDTLFEARLSARALPRENMMWTAERRGWLLDFWVNPVCDDTPFRVAYANDDEYDRIFSHLRVCAWKMIRA